MEVPKYLKISYNLLLGLSSLFVLQGPLSSVWELGTRSVVRTLTDGQESGLDRSSPKHIEDHEIRQANVSIYDVFSYKLTQTNYVHCI